MTKPKWPNDRRNLGITIDRFCICTGQEPAHVRRLIATVIVGQMLPNGAAKGGNALKIRFDKDVMRFSCGLDTVCASSLEGCVPRPEGSLTDGRSGFTGIVVPKEPTSSRGIPAAYVMRPSNIKPTYDGKS